VSEVGGFSHSRATAKYDVLLAPASRLKVFNQVIYAGTN
jgi:hypothetical protein